jgi:hypothetical protein
MRIPGIFMRLGSRWTLLQLQELLPEPTGLAALEQYSQAIENGLQSSCFNAFGGAIPPLVISEAAMHQAAWYEDDIIPHVWLIGVSEIGLTRLKLFHEHTKDRTVGTHRLLVLDGHGSHIKPKFDQFCLVHKIIVGCMLARLSHLLQPLDVGCFSVLKQLYGSLVVQIMGCGVNHIVKREFLPLYRQARQPALH